MPNANVVPPSCVVVADPVLVVGEEEEEGFSSLLLDSQKCRHDDDHDCNKSVDDTATVVSMGSSSTSSGSSSCSKDDEEELESIETTTNVVVVPSLVVKNNKQQEQQLQPEYFQVVIVGAGAAGLQCAHTLIHEHGLKPSDIVILEARNRVGGRICTIQEDNESSICSTGTSSSGYFTRDLGAAWVHGTRLNSKTNPVLELLRASAENQKNNTASQSQSITTCSSGSDSPATNENDDNDDDDNDDDHLLTIQGIQNDPILRDLIKPVHAGNPWMRPKTILHDNGGIALYVQQQQQPQQESQQESSLQEEQRTTMLNHPQEDNVIIQQALRQHFEILKDVSKKVTSMYTNGEGMDTIHCSIGRYLQEASASSLLSLSQQTAAGGEEEESDSNRIQQQRQTTTAAALTGFYQHLLTCWYGRSLFDLQLGYFDNSTDDIDTAAANDDVDDASFVEYGDFAGPHCTVHNGMQQLLEPLLQEHDLERNCIRLGQVVTSIYPYCNDEHSTTGAVVVETAQGGCVYGKTCVVTLPLGCLRHEQESNNDNDDNNGIFAKTPLSEEKQIAIQHMNMGAYKKVFLTFDRYFWDTKPAFLGLVLMPNATDNDDDKVQKENPLGNYLLLNNLYTATNNKPCLEAILAGDQGTWATGKSDEVIQSAVLDFMQQAMMIMPTPSSSSSSDSSNHRDEIKDWCTSCHVTRWEEDIYSRGAYSSWSLGALPRHKIELSRPEWNERLYFAGEATHDGFEGSVHAALLSGKHAASNVSKHLSLDDQDSKRNNSNNNNTPETSQKLH